MTDQGLTLVEEPINTEVAKTVKVKYALSVKKDFDPYKITLQELLAKEAFLDDRAVCESNKEQLQFIVYITYVDISEPNVKYLGYTRGAAGGEDRLKGKVSFGIGGHVEEAPTADKSLAHVLAHSASLEASEETGLEIPTRIFEEAFKNVHAVYGDEGNRLCVSLGNQPVMYNETDDVSCVHLAISIIIHGNINSFKSFGFGTMEEGIITKCKWLNRQEIYEASIVEKDPIQLEAWSTQFFNIMFPDGIAEVVKH